MRTRQIGYVLYLSICASMHVLQKLACLQGCKIVSTCPSKHIQDYQTSKLFFFSPLLLHG